MMGCQSVDRSVGRSVGQLVGWVVGVSFTLVEYLIFYFLGAWVFNFE